MMLTKFQNSAKNGIVIPCYNEAERLELFEFEKFAIENPDYLICFVNDGSKDNTLVMLKFFAAKFRNVTVLGLPQNVGKAEAVRQGILHLLETTQVETVGFMDADLSTDFQDYGNLVSKLTDNNNNLACAFGSRKQEENSTIERTLFRDIASKIVSTMIKSVLRLPIHDTQCGAKVFSSQIARVCFSNSFTTRWLFDVEIFLKLKKVYGRRDIMSRIQEVPLKRWIHVEGSKISLKDAVKIPGMLLKIVLDYNLQSYLSEPILEIKKLYPELDAKAA